MAKKDFDLKFYEIEERYDKLLKQLPAVVSNMAVNDFKDNFRRQGYRNTGGGVVKWKPRAKVKNARDGNRAILIKSGLLRRGFKPAPIGLTARVINNVPYAEALNNGSNKSVKVKAHKRFRYKKIKVAVGGKTKKGTAKTKTLMQRTNVSRVKSHTRKQNLKARPFMITTQPLLTEIDKYTERKLELLFK